MKNKINITISAYKVEIQDYKYKSRPPVGVMVSGTLLGECKNSFGEDCYFFKSANAMSMDEGRAIAKQIIAERIK